MNRKKLLSSTYNMSFGLLPAMITMILCEFICQEIAIYIGLGLAGIQLFIYYGRKAKKPNFILDMTAIVLLALTISTFFYDNYCPQGMIPITIEATIIIPLFLIFLHKNRFISYFLYRRKSENRHYFAQGAQASIVSSRVLFILGSLHFLILTVFILLGTIESEPTHWIMFRLSPILVLSLSIILNQAAINYFNKTIADADYYPIVNKRGYVIGRASKDDVQSNKGQYIYPVIRIALIAGNELLLCKRPITAFIEKDKIDVPIEGFLRYNESISNGVQRLIKENLPHMDKEIEPLYHMTYYFKNEETNRLIYCFSIDIEKEQIKGGFKKRDAKFWTIDDIKQRIQTPFFCDLLQEEFEHINQVIYTREKYKES